MKNFIIFFTGAEGSSWLISLLGKLPGVNIIGFEPFDNHVFVRNGFGKRMTHEDLHKCYHILFGDTKDKQGEINKIYHKYIDQDLDISINEYTRSFGFKTREVAPSIKYLIKHKNFVPIFLYRANKLKYAISMLRGQLQFNHLRGEKVDQSKKFFKLEDIGEKIAWHDKKLAQFVNYQRMLSKYKIPYVVIRYEDLLYSKIPTLRKITNTLGFEFHDKQLEKVDTRYKKMTNDDLKNVILNYEEIEAKYGAFM